MFSLFYGAFTGVEYFSDGDETPPPSTSTSPAKSRKPSNEVLSPASLTQQPPQPKGGPVASPSDIDRNLTESLTNNKMTGRYHSLSRDDVSDHCSHASTEFFTLPRGENCERQKDITKKFARPTEEQVTKGGGHQHSSCRRRHRAPTP